MSHPRKQTRSLLLVATTCLLVSLSGCSGISVDPESTAEFALANYKRYAWRSEPPSKSKFTRDILAKKSASIREGTVQKMSELGYTLVEKDDAEFLIEYLATTGAIDGQLAYGGSNEGLYGSSVNRDIDGASSDNAIELSNALQTGDIQLVFVDNTSSKILWRVAISMVVEDANKVDEAEVRRAVRQGLSSLPAAQF